LLGRFAPHYQRDLVVLFCVFLGGVLLVLGSVQVMAVRDLRMMSGLFMIAGFMMFGCFAMVLGGVLMMLRGVLNLVIVHGSLSGLLERPQALRRSMNS
jgi:hypothetical protein